MSKRRKGHQSVHYQVPSLIQLATRAVQRNEGKHFKWNSRAWKGRITMDTTMSESRSTGTQTKRARTDGAMETGQGLTVTVPRAVPHLYNNTYTVKLTYADNFRHDIAQTGAAGSTQYFRTNSIFDPDVTGTGHQPLMRDLWASQYDYYSVLSCEYEIWLYNCFADPVTFTAVGTSAQRVGCVNVALVTSTTANDITDPPTSGRIYPHWETKNTQTRFLVPEDVVKFEGTLTQGDFILDAVDQDTDKTWTAIGSNPAVARYLGYSITPAQWTGLTGASETPYSSIQVAVKFHYTVQFTQIASSLRVAAS